LNQDPSSSNPIVGGHVQRDNARVILRVVSMKFGHIVLAAALLALSTSALAQRNVWVNGQRMSSHQLSQLDRAHCGIVPNGGYWLNLRTGVWGYWNNPRPQGHIADNCGQRGSAVGSGHRLDRGPFGTYMSDGRCSFVNGVPVGDC
jgi:hypothetical protein